MAGSKMDIKTKVDTGKVTGLKVVLYIALALVILIAPVVLQVAGQSFLIRILAVVGIYIVLALGLNIVVGYAGLLDLGYIAFYAIGAYVGAYLPQFITVKDAVERYTSAGGKLPSGFSTWSIVFWSEPMQKLASESDFMMAMLDASTKNVWLPWMFLLCIPVAALAAAITGVILGTPVLRLRGDYLAIVTLGFGEIVRILFTNDVGGLTNGAAGLPRAGVRMPDPAGMKDIQAWVADAVVKYDLNPFISFSRNEYWYYFIFVMCLVTIFVVRRLNDSRIGRSWTALREDEVAASSMGINITATKLWAFSLGALWGGVAGVVFANYQTFVSPESFTFMESVFVVSIIVLGGMGSIPGAVVGAFVIQGVPELIRGLASSGIIDVSAEAQSAISQYRYLVFGLLMVVMMAWRPQGLIPSRRRARELVADDVKTVEDQNETLYDAQHGTARPGDESDF